jgi:hypothetical protein
MGRGKTMERSGICGSVIALLIVVALSLIATGIEPVAKIIADSSSPVSITQYRAYYQQRVGTYIDEGIRHELQYRNDSSRTIVAVQFGLISFGVFNDFLDRTGGVSMDEIAAGQSDSGTWIATAFSDFTFLTGVAYAGAVGKLYRGSC